MDTSQLATKTDLKAVKTELQSDIQKLELSTKADLKTEIKTVKGDTTSLRQEVKYLRKDMLRLEERVENIEEDIKEINTGLGAKLDKLQNTMDGFLGTVDDLRTDNTVGTQHTRELQKRVDNHEERLQHLESSKHAA